MYREDVFMGSIIQRDLGRPIRAQDIDKYKASEASVLISMYDVRKI
jgi:hypothetical protein